MFFLSSGPLESLPTIASMNASDPEPPSTAYSDLDAATDLTGFDVNREATADTTSSAAHSGYEGIDWNRLPGYVASRHRRRQRTGWVWEHGYDVERSNSGRRFWLCKECSRRPPIREAVAGNDPCRSAGWGVCDGLLFWVVDVEFQRFDNIQGRCLFFQPFCECGQSSARLINESMFPV
ncbi:transposase-like protein [Metarhizium brunneum]